MSKIFDAYRKQMQEAPDIGEDIARVEPSVLFPGPGAHQKVEFSKLANRMLGLRQNRRGSAICFASSVPGEGASFVSYNTARVLAHDYGQKVAWIDVNFLSPQEKLNALNEVSFSTLIKDPDKVREMTTSVGLHLIPGGENLVGARGHFAGESFQRLLLELNLVFDFAILDLPPVLKSTDTALVASSTDGLLLVVEQKLLKWEVINHGVDSLREKNVKILGSVINRREFDLPKVLYDRL